MYEYIYFEDITSNYEFAKILRQILYYITRLVSRVTHIGESQERKYKEWQQRW